MEEMTPATNLTRRYVLCAWSLAGYLALNLLHVIVGLAVLRPEERRPVAVVISAIFWPILAALGVWLIVRVRRGRSLWVAWGVLAFFGLSWLTALGMILASHSTERTATPVTVIEVAMAGVWVWTFGLVTATLVGNKNPVSR